MRFIETTKGNVAFWTIQGLLALLFVFAGGSKLMMPADALAAQAHMPGLFLELIGVCELAGGLGLILPGIFRTARFLTPLAAAGLTIIMAGAVFVSAAQMGVAAAVPALVAGVLSAFVAHARWPRSSTFSQPHCAS